MKVTKISNLQNGDFFLRVIPGHNWHWGKIVDNKIPKAFSIFYNIKTNTVIGNGWDNFDLVDYKKGWKTITLPKCDYLEMICGKI